MGNRFEFIIYRGALSEKVPVLKFTNNEIIEFRENITSINSLRIEKSSILYLILNSKNWGYRIAVLGSMLYYRDHKDSIEYVIEEIPQEKEIIIKQELIQYNKNVPNSRIFFLKE